NSRGEKLCVRGVYHEQGAGAIPLAGLIAARLGWLRRLPADLQIVPDSIKAAVSPETGALLQGALSLKGGKSPSSFIMTRQGKRSLDERVYDALARAKVLTAHVAMHLN